MSKDYYNILGVSKTASQDEIKKAYRKLAHQHHPDKKGGDEQKFKEANEAYQVLGDAQKRSQYNQFGSSFNGAGGGAGGGFGGFSDFAEAFKNGNFQQAGGDFGDLGDIFGSMFGGGRRGGGAGGVRKGRDISIDMEVGLEEIFNTTKRTLKINKTNTCSKCQGSGGEPGTAMKNCAKCGGKGKISQQHRTPFGVFAQESLCADCGGAGKTPEKNCSDCRGAGVKQGPQEISLEVPAGIESGTTLRFTGKGEAVKGGTSGDLYVVVRVKPHKLFERQGSDLFYKLPIKFTQAVLGDSVDIPAIDGDVKLKIPAGTEAGKMLQLMGKGLPRFHQYGRGDIYVKINVMVPKKLSRRAKKLLEELNNELND